MFRKIRNLFSHKPSDEYIALYNAHMDLQMYVIALARLFFIKPDNLVREQQNKTDNTEYLVKMVKALNPYETIKKSNKTDKAS